MKITKELQILDFINKKFERYDLISHVFYDACINNRKDVVEYMLQNLLKRNTYNLEHGISLAVQCNNFEITKYLIDNFIDNKNFVECEINDYIASGGYRDAMTRFKKWLEDENN